MLCVFSIFLVTRSVELSGQRTQVNNAAVSFNDVDENSVDNAETVIKTNFYGPKLLTEALLPLFRRSASTSRILNISSRLGSFNVSLLSSVNEILHRISI